MSDPFPSDPMPDVASPDPTPTAVRRAESWPTDNRQSGPEQTADPARAGEPTAAVTAAGNVTAPPKVSLVANHDRFRLRWDSVQVGFVDDPRRAVHEAGQLVDDVIADLVNGFQAQRDRMGSTGEESTEQLRVAFQRFRTFFGRLLDV